MTSEDCSSTDSKKLAEELEAISFLGALWIPVSPFLHTALAIKLVEKCAPDAVFSPHRV